MKSPNMDFDMNCSTVNVRNLEGKMLTQIEASFSDPTQREAMKDIFRSMLWDWAYLLTKTHSGSIDAKMHHLEIK